MKQISTYIFEHSKNSKFSILERLHINKNIDNHYYYNYHPKTKVELINIVDQLIKERGKDADLNDIDTSEITDMYQLFYDSKFNGDISGWNVSNVKDIGRMFQYSEFTGENGDISIWNVSNVKNMHCAFYGSKFNGDISNWDVRNAEDMDEMFYNSPLEKNPPKCHKE